MRYRFDRFELDLASGRLLDAGVAVPLQPKAFELLRILVEQPGVLLGRDELERRLWPGVHVTSSSLTQAVARVRRAVGPAVVEVLARRGYRLTVEVSREALPRSAGARDRERGLAGAALAEGRPVLLHGPPGIGKSWLARALSAGTRVEVPLAGCRDAPAVAAAFARALGSDEGSGPVETADRVGAALAWRGELVVVVDGADALDAGARALLARWIAAAPRARFVITSRTRPVVDGERIVEVGALADEDGVGLLRERLPSPPADARLLPVVRALDGNPLALVLAAGRLRLLSPEELLERLDAGVLREPGDGGLEAAVASSWALLDERERELLVRLAVAAAPLPLADAEALAGPGAEAARVLQRLGDHAWLAIEPLPAGTRLGVHRHLREWVLAHADRALVRVAVDDLGGRLAAEAAELVPRAVLTADPVAWGWIRARIDVVDGLLADPDLDLRCRWPLVHVAGLARQMWGSATELLELAVRTLADGDVVPPGLRATAAGWRAIHSRLVDGEPHVDEAREALVEARRAGDLRMAAEAEADLALALLAGGRREEALAASRSALAVAHDAGQPHALSHALVTFAVLRWTDPEGLGALRRALELPLAETSWVRLRALAELATASHDAGRWGDAEARYRERLAAVEPWLDPTWHRVTLLSNLANLLGDTLRFDEAHRVCAEGEALARAAGRRDLVARCALVAADCAIDAGRPADAEALARPLVEDASGPAAYRAQARMLLAIAALRAGDVESAAVRAEAALGPTHRGSAGAPEWFFGTVIAAAAGDAEAAAERLAAGRSRLDARPVRALRALEILAAAFEARARREPGARSLARLDEPGAPEPAWPDGAPPLRIHLQRHRWVLDRLAR